MRSGLSNLLTPGGSGFHLRRLAESSLRAIKEWDALVFTKPKTPHGFDFNLLGEKLLISLDDDGQMLSVVSAVPGNGYRWEGVATPKAEFLDAVMPDENEIDRQRFIDFVYNFKHILYDLDDNSLRIIDPDEAEALRAQSSRTQIPGVVRVAFER